VNAEKAPVVVIGAGCIGAAIAWHLGRRGVRGVVVLEREPFAGAGSTSKAAGGIRAQFSTPINVQISMLAVAQFARFAQELRTEPLYFPVGYLFVLTESERWHSFRSLDDIEQTLQRLDTNGFVKQLAGRPGQKESRWQTLVDLIARFLSETRP
jgi:glycine/D-amino acid oxidase-like deaminating enzyme